MVKGILFDMDGVLFDTERLSIAVCSAIVQDMGYELPEDILEKTCGTNPAAYRRIMLDALGEDFDYDSYSTRMHKDMATSIEQNGLPTMPGLEETLDTLRIEGYKMAVASSTRYETVCSHLIRAGIAGYFSAVVGGDMVENSKPHPEIFQKAAKALGLPPEECAAVEDSHNGVRSAAAAGCVTVMIPDMMQPTEELRAISAAVLPSLRELPVFLEEYNA